MVTVERFLCQALCGSFKDRDASGFIHFMPRSVFEARLLSADTLGILVSSPIEVSCHSQGVGYGLISLPSPTSLFPRGRPPF